MNIVQFKNWKKSGHEKRVKFLEWSRKILFIIMKNIIYHIFKWAKYYFELFSQSI